MPSSAPAVDETLCPVCGKPNGCGAHDAAPCWCGKETISPALRALVPPEKRMRACLCIGCMRRHADAPAATDSSEASRMFRQPLMIGPAVEGAQQLDISQA